MIPTPVTAPLTLQPPNFAANELYCLAAERCGCKGAGWQYDTSQDGDVCKCVQKTRFRDCLQHYHSIECSPTYVRAEFRADFELAARRTLDPLDLAVFRAYHVWGLAWPECLAALGRLRRNGVLPHRAINRGQLFHAVYRIEERVGRELELAGMHPTRLYYQRKYKTQ